MRDDSVSRLEFSAAYLDSGQASPLHFLLLEPDGTYAAYSLPQGLGDYAEVEVANPPPGTWTAVFFTASPAVESETKGPVQWSESTSVYGSAGAISPSTLDIPAGQSASANLTLVSPTTPGDTSQSVVIAPEGGEATTIPVTVRTAIPMGPDGGSFRGVLTGGNGRPGNDSQTNTYVFKVPGGLKDLDVSFAFKNDPADEVLAYLVDGSGQTLGYSTNYTVTKGGKPSSTRFVQLYHTNPRGGQWKLVLQFADPVSGMEVQEPFKGVIHFNQVSVSSNLPDNSSVHLTDGSSYSFTVKVKNTGVAPEAFFADPQTAPAPNSKTVPTGCPTSTAQPLALAREPASVSHAANNNPPETRS